MGSVTGKLFYRLVSFHFPFPPIPISSLTKFLICLLPKKLLRKASWKRRFKTPFNNQISFCLSLQKQLFSPANKDFPQAFFPPSLKSLLSPPTSFETGSSISAAISPVPATQRRRCHSSARQRRIVRSQRRAQHSLPDKHKLIHLTLAIHCFPGCPPCQPDLHSLFPDPSSCLCKGVP